MPGFAMGLFAMIRTLLLAAGASLAFAAPSHAVVNLVANGSFESGLASWTVGGTDTQGFPPVAIFYNSATGYPTGAYGEAVAPNNSPTNSPDGVGDRAAYFVSDRTVDQSLTQSVFLDVGTYQIGFSAYAPANGYRNVGEARFSGTVAGVTLANYTVSSGPVTSWQTFAGVANIATAGLYDVSFVFNTNRVPSKDVVIDQVYIIAGNPPVPGVPEAATWAMLIAGFGMVGFAARRKALVRA